MADLLQSSAAANILPPEPGSGLKTLSSILGLKKQQQDLDTGLATQASAQAKATVDTQSANENQGLARLLSDPVGNGIVDSNGNPTKNAQSIILRTAPTTGSDAYEKVVNAATSKVRLNGAVNNLRADQRQAAVNAIAGPAANPNATYDDVKASLQNLVDANKGTENEDDYKTIQGTLTTALDHVSKLQKDKGLVIPPGQEAWRTGSLNFARGSLGSAGVVGAGGIANPVQTTNAEGQNQLANPITGARSVPELQGGATNPTSPQVAGRTVRETGTGNADVDTSNMVVASQRDARTNIDLTKRIDQLAEIVNPGAAPAKISALLGSTGLTDVNQARTELQKDLARLKGNLASKAQSDSRAGPILDSLPDETKPTQTIHQAMDVTRGLARQDLALGALREKAAKETGGQLNGFQGEYAHAVAAASPLMHEYLSLTPQEQVEFFKRNFRSREQAKAFRDQAEAVKKRSPDVIGQ